MLEWLVLVVVIGFIVNLSGRMRRAEQRLAELSQAELYGYRAMEPEMSPAADRAEEEAAPEPVQAEPVPVMAEREPVAALQSEAVEAQGEPLEPLEPLDEEPERPRFAIGFEELFGRRLPIWAGGITLAIAGMLIVKLSIDSGLLTPPIRVISGLLFGAALIAAAEVARRQEERIRDPRVRQALAGAGIASLYASVLIATNLYGLVGPLAAMLAMAAVTALALFLATRFGAPSALLGLAGGLAAPALIGSDEPNVPLLALYLALAVGGLCTLSRNQRWLWLGVSALVGGFGWGLLLLLGGALDAPGSISLGLYLLLIGVAIPALGFAGDRRSQLQLIAGIVAAAQMAALVATGGFTLLNWGLFGLLAAASHWLARRDSQLARLPAVGALIALLLLGAWPYPHGNDFALVTAGTLLIYGVPAALRLWKADGGLIEAGQIGALALGGLLLPMLHFHEADGGNDLLFGLLALGLAIVPAACAAAGWKHPDRRLDARFALLATAAALLLAAAAPLLLPVWLAGVAIAGLGLGLLHLGQAAGDRRLEPMAWIFAAVGALVYPYAQLADGIGYPDPIDALHWALQGLIAGAFAWRAGIALLGKLAQFLVPMFLFAALSLLVPSRFEALIPPALLVAAAWVAARVSRQRLVWAMASSALLVALIALPPAYSWALAATRSAMGMAMMVMDVATPENALLELVVPALLTAAALWIARRRLRPSEAKAGIALAVTLAGIGAHCLYKQLFAIASPDAFVTNGLAERLVWELLLIGGGALALRFGARMAGLGLAAAGAGHLLLYSLLLHNPLIVEQAVGGLPVVNLLLPLYGLAMALAVAAPRLLPLPDGARRALGIAQMLLVLLFAFSTLRQLFHGSLLAMPGVMTAEDIGRSILAIALAIGFLLWGIARRDRDWRIASLVLMLAAVAKVFLLDASGLEGLTRIASFVALGLSLIGIGWLYSRHLAVDRAPAAA